MMPKVLQIALLVTATAAVAVLATAIVLGAHKRGEAAPEPLPAPAPAVRIGNAAALSETTGSAAAVGDAVSVAVNATAAAEPVPNSGPLPPALWESFKARFVMQDGRVIDDANGNVSHSEGQGYGMLLAAFAGDAETFARLWAWTETELLVRDDGLAAWRWDPDATPHVTDINNATDGDILIAWALMRGAERFGDERYRASAAALATAIHGEVTKGTRHGRVLMPGVAGFGADDRPDGPVVNLSYWVFPAFPALKQAAAELRWDDIAKSGLTLLGKSQFGPRNLPTDWIALGNGEPRPANAFPPSFAYNAIRVPLYLAWGMAGDREHLAPFMSLWSDDAPLSTIDVHSGEPVESLEGVGYRAVAALVACAMEGKPIPTELRAPSPDHYYPTVLQALSLAAAEEVYSGCR